MTKDRERFREAVRRFGEGEGRVQDLWDAVPARPAPVVIHPRDATVKGIIRWAPKTSTAGRLRSKVRR